jgi:Domain of unknown function (DUF4283)
MEKAVDSDPLARTIQAMEQSLKQLNELLNSSLQAQRPSYKQAVLRPAHFRAQHQWRRRDSALSNGDDRVSKRVDLIKKSSSPMCIKCGDKGHFAKDCRNATLCFRCLGLGHKSFHCKHPQSTSPKSNIAAPQKSLPTPSPLVDREVPPTIVTPPIRFCSSEASQKLEASFDNSIVLTDSAGIGRSRIEAALRHQMPQHQWIARYYDDSRFLIEAPSPRWLNTVTNRGSLRVENMDLPVARWDPAMDEGAKLRPVWVQVRGFPMKLWFFHEFTHLFEPFGQVLALDPATAEHLDFRVARVRVGLCAATQLPSMQWVMYCDPQGYWTRYDVSMEVEQPAFGQTFSQSIPPMGQGPGGTGSKPRGRAHLGEGSNNSARVAPPTKKSNTGDSSKDKNPIQPGDEEYDIMESGDLVLIPPLNQEIDDVVVGKKGISVPMCSSPPSATFHTSFPPHSFPEGLNHESAQDTDSLLTDTEMLNLQSAPSMVPDTLMEISGTNISSSRAEAEVDGEELTLIQAQSQTLSQPSMLLVSPPPCIRRSIRLKVKGLQGSSKAKAQLASGSALISQFPFGRLTNDEVADLFRTYRVKLGTTMEQRDAIIQNIRHKWS